MTALVTGANGEIGRAIVRGLESRGVAVVEQDIRFDRPSTGGRVMIEGDLLQSSTHEHIRNAAMEWSVDTVIAAHGVDGSGALEHLTHDYIARVLRVNAASVFQLFESTQPSLRELRGSFVVISSQAGLTGEPDNSVYSASKHALVGWARALRSTFEDDRVRVAVLAPGCVDTRLFRAAQARFAEERNISVAQMIDQRLHRIPQRRFASTDQIAHAAIYLADRNHPVPPILAPTGGETTY